MRKIILAITLLAFLALTAVAVWEHGYVGVFAHQFQNSAGVQVLVDLVIALGLFMVWLWQDARAAGRNPWPWLVLILATGSIGALVYVLRYKSAASTKA